MIFVSADIENFEIYIYIIILTIISAYMFYVNYFNTLQKEEGRNKFRPLLIMMIEFNLFQSINVFVYFLILQ